MPGIFGDLDITVFYASTPDGLRRTSLTELQQCSSFASIGLP